MNSKDRQLTKPYVNNYKYLRIYIDSNGSLE